MVSFRVRNRSHTCAFNQTSNGITPGGIVSNGIWTIDGRWTKRTLLCARGECQSVRQAPQHPTSTELEESASHFAAGPGDYHWLTARVPLAFAQVLQKNPAVCRCGSMLGNGIARIIPRNWVVTYPRSWRRSITTRTAYSQVPNWGERTYHCCSQK